MKKYFASTGIALITMLLSVVLLAITSCNPEQEQAVADEITEVISDIETSIQESEKENSDQVQIIRKIETIDTDDLEVYIRMKAGILQVKGGTENLIHAGFVVTNKDKEPQINYEKKQNTGILKITEPGNDEGLVVNDSTKNVWNIKLNEYIETELNIEIGAGKAVIYASDLDISYLNIKAGAGKLDIYLNKNFRRDVQVKIAGGIGLTNIYLPTNQAVMVTANKGFGAINNKGLIQDGSNYTNALYKTSNEVIRIDVNAGIGAINLISD